MNKCTTFSMKVADEWLTVIKKLIAVEYWFGTIQLDLSVMISSYHKNLVVIRSTSFLIAVYKSHEYCSNELKKTKVNERTGFISRHL